MCTLEEAERRQQCKSCTAIFVRGRMPASDGTFWWPSHVVHASSLSSVQSAGCNTRAHVGACLMHHVFKMLFAASHEGEGVAAAPLAPLLGSPVCAAQQRQGRGRVISCSQKAGVVSG